MTYEELQTWVDQALCALEDGDRKRAMTDLLGRFHRESVQEAAKLPSPDHVALAIIQGILAGNGAPGDEGVPTAAVAMAWHLVPHYYIERENYARNIAPMFFKEKGADDEGLAKLD
jgi:hypothetical protein